MGELRKGGSVAWAVTIALAALLAMYVGAYYAMVRPEYMKFQNMYGASWIVVAPRYSHSDDDGRSVAARAFAPAHWLDCRIRPHLWESQTDPNPLPKMKGLWR